MSSDVKKPRRATFVVSLILPATFLFASAGGAVAGERPGPDGRGDAGRGEKAAEGERPLSAGLPVVIRSLPPLKKAGRRHPRRKAPQPQSLPPARLRLQVGEKLTYGVRWNGLPAGEATLTVTDRDKTAGAEVWVVRLRVRSSRIVSAFYPVKIKITSRVDAAGGFSRGYNAVRHEGELNAREQIRFDYTVDEPHAVCRRPRSDGKMRIYKVPLPGKALDSLAVIYYLRAVPLGLKAPSAWLPIVAARRLHNQAVRPTGREELEVSGLGAGSDRRLCWILDLDCPFPGLFARRSGMRIWLDQKTHIPLKMKVEIPIGEATVQLKKQENSPLDPAYRRPPPPPPERATAP